MGKIKSKKNNYRHEPLDQQILENKFAKQSSRNKSRSRQPEDDKFVDDKRTKKILKQASEQLAEIKKENELPNVGAIEALQISSTSDATHDSEEENSNFSDKEEFEEIKISEEDEKAFESFMSKDIEKRTTLADFIKEKLTEKQTEFYTICSDTATANIENSRAAYYKELVPALQNYKSGPLPKAFKAIPKFTYWEQILYLTEPDKWSAATMYQATRIFSSNLSDKMAQRFYNLILLPRLRDDLAECKVLNFHLYQALKKALFKPAAFFKGIILPLAEPRNGCTLREATIFASVLAKCSIPMLHSAAALMTIAEMDYSGANSIFMRVLLEKKYALPYRVLNSIVSHFLKFVNDKRQYPLLWHQCLLTFVQIYKNDLSQQQKQDLLKLLTVHHHDHVTPEIRRELQSVSETSTVAMESDT